MKKISKSILFHIVTNAIFGINAFLPSKTGAGLYNTKVFGKLVHGTVAEYKKVFCLQPAKYVQVHQEDEPGNTIDIDQTVESIVLGPQYNLQGGFC